MNDIINISSKIIGVASKIIGAIAITSAIIYFSINYKILPDYIPSDFDIGKSPNEYSHKIFLLIYMANSFGLYLLIFGYKHTKRIHFYPVRLNENNREIQYKLSISSLKLISLCIIFFLCEISVYLSEIGLSRSRFHGWFDLFLLYFSIGFISIIFIILSFLKK